MAEDDIRMCRKCNLPYRPDQAMYRYNKVELVGEGSIMVTEKIAINPNERCPKCGAYLAQESMS